MKKPVIKPSNMDPLEHQVSFEAGADAMYSALEDQGGLQAWVEGAPESAGLYLLQTSLDLQPYVLQPRIAASFAFLDRDGKQHLDTCIKRHMRINTDD